MKTESAVSETISISRFEADCLNWLVNVSKTGKSIIVTYKDKPIALITPPPQPIKHCRWLDCMKDRIKINGDIVSPAVDETEWEVLKD